MVNALLAEVMSKTQTIPTTEQVNEIVKATLPSSEQSLTLKPRLGALMATVHEHTQHSIDSLKAAKRLIRRAQKIEMLVETGEGSVFGVDSDESNDTSRVAQDASDSRTGASDQSEKDSFDTDLSDTDADANLANLRALEPKSSQSHEAKLGERRHSIEATDRSPQQAVQVGSNPIEAVAKAGRRSAPKEWKPTSERLFLRLQALDKPPLPPMDVLELSLGQLEQTYQQIPGLMRALHTVQKLSEESVSARLRTTQAFKALSAEREHYIVPEIAKLESCVGELNNLLPRVEAWERAYADLEAFLSESPSKIDAKISQLVSSMKELAAEIAQGASYFNELLVKGQTQEEKAAAERDRRFGKAVNWRHEARTVRGEAEATERLMKQLELLDKGVTTWAGKSIRLHQSGSAVGGKQEESESTGTPKSEKTDENSGPISWSENGRLRARVARLSEYVREFLEEVQTMRGSMKGVDKVRHPKLLSISPPDFNHGEWIMKANQRLSQALLHCTRLVSEASQVLTQMVPEARQYVLQERTELRQAKTEVVHLRTLVLTPSVVPAKR